MGWPLPDPPIPMVGTLETKEQWEARAQKYADYKLRVEMCNLIGCSGLSENCPGNELCGILRKIIN